MKALQPFWHWYERHHALAVTITAILFSWQLVHLFWLTTVVVWGKIFGVAAIAVPDYLELLLAVIDYTEIPAIISASILYLHQLQKKMSWRPLLFLVLLNSQWLHLFWITDEFVVEKFSSATLGLPLWLALIAIAIDYLELPVIYDTIRHSLKAIRKQPT